MMIHVKSNIFLPGVEQKEHLDVDRPKLTVREFLEELSGLAGPKRVTYVRPGAPTVEDDWEVRVNDVDLRDFGGVDSNLKDGDTVTVNMLVVGGG